MGGGRGGGCGPELGLISCGKGGRGGCGMCGPIIGPEVGGRMLF